MGWTALIGIAAAIHLLGFLYHRHRANARFDFVENSIETNHEETKKSLAASGLDGALVELRRIIDEHAKALAEVQSTVQGDSTTSASERKVLSARADKLVAGSMMLREQVDDLKARVDTLSLRAGTMPTDVGL